ncbi:MAG: DnaB-like helicase C-terminal domain-containing protein [Bacilli bacterium]|nr:DnaB-like helicase C-terminal domain-containing protein [Bacilli bacterium]
MREEIEKSFIAYLIIYPENLLNIQIKPKYLSDKKNKLLLEHLINHYKKYKKISLAKLIEENKNFDRDYYFELVADQFYEKNLTDYEEIILNHYKQDILKDLNKKLDNELITFNEFVSKIKKIDDYQIVKVKKLDAGEIENNLKSNVKINLTNFPKLNQVLRLVRNDFLIVGATTGAGKSSLLLNIMNDLMNDYQCIYFNLEMAKSTIYQRLIAINSGLPVDHITSPKSEHQAETIKNTIKELENKGLIIEHQVSEIKQIRSLIAKVKTDKHTIVFIDHLGLISVDSNKSLYEKTTEIAKALRQISLNYDCTIIGASQLNRSAYSSENINLSMLKDSGEMENSASKVILLHKQKTIHEEDKISELDVEVAKNRDGLIGFIKFEYQKKKQIFKEVE